MMVCAGQTRAQKTERAVLEDVPYIGMDWQTRLDGPQDFTFPSAMRSVLTYLGESDERDYRYYLAISGQGFQQLWHRESWRSGFDRPWLVDAEPGHAARRMFAAAGYSYDVIGTTTRPADIEIPDGSFTEEVTPDELRERVCASIDAGVPALVCGDWLGWAVIAGYEAGGQSLVGWHLAVTETENDELGYVRLRDWLDSAYVAIIVGEKGEAPPIRETYREALVWAVKAARAPEVGAWAAGLEAIQAWGEAMDNVPGIDDPVARKKAYEAHDGQALAIAEGRAFMNDILKRIAADEPDAAEDLLEAARCYGVMHDLMWRVWKTPGGWGPGPEDASLSGFANPDVRDELKRVILTVCDLDAKAISHIERALRTMGVDPAAIAEPLGWEAEAVARLIAREASSGAAPAALRHEVTNVWVDGVPDLGFGRQKDCAFIGALDGALATTERPVSYADLMGHSGLAFRTRWFRNPDGAATAWGTGRWHPDSPHGDGDEEVAAISRATGWRFRTEEWPEDNQLGRDRLVTDIVLSLNEGLPLVIGRNTGLATVYGYHIHAMDLVLRDYEQPDEELRINAHDEGWHSPLVLLSGLGEAPDSEDAFFASLGNAAADSAREADEFRYGLDALEAWREDIAAYDAYTDDEKQLLFGVNWWCVMHLVDARRSAVAFLDGNVDLLEGDARQAVLNALEIYQEESGLLTAFAEDNWRFIQWWGGEDGAAQWDAQARADQVELLAKCRELEETALAELAKVDDGRA